MSDLPPPELVAPEPSKRDRRIVWTAGISVLLHAGVLGFVLWPPLRDRAEAAPPPAIEVELVSEPEISSSQPPPSLEMPSSLEPPSSETPESSEAPAAEPSAETASSAEMPSAEPPSSGQPAGPAASSAEASSQEASSPEAPSSTEAGAVSEASPSAVPSAPEAAASAAAEPPLASQASTEPPPAPMSRPIVIPLGPTEDASAAASSAPEEGVSALIASTGEVADGIAPAASAEPDVAALGLGALYSAERFYLEAMLSAPSMARAREVLETLPREKRLSQTCNIEAIAQIGSAGRGFAPDVVMSDAYAKSVMAGTRFTAAGAIFRSGQKWYGVAFDCTLSEDLTSVTAFSYRLGADVTEAVVARLGRQQ